MNINIKKEIGIGFLFGLLANFTGMFFYVAIFLDTDFEKILRTAHEQDLLGSIIVLGAVLNFIPFFYFIRKNLIYKARGVLIATILAAVTVAILKIV